HDGARHDDGYRREPHPDERRADYGYQREVHHHHEAPPAYAAHPDAVQPRRSKGLGVAAMICGIVGLLLLFVPLLQIASLILCPLAIILGIIAAKKREGRGQGIAGIITGAIGVVLIALGIILAVVFGDDIMQELNRLEQEAGAILPLLF
ncbi:MAG: DUF4190 domain-containing protein, partial [Nesterenkonia sp.]|nr:DUF4190 domain-containing protein [Nesterenkonia sp.]